MAAQRVGGLIEIAVDGALINAKGSFTYNIGTPVREGIVGHDRVHGYKELPQIPYLEGAITDASTLNLKSLQSVKDATINLTVANGKTIVFNDAWFAGEGSVSTEEGEIAARFEAKSASELPPL